MELIFMYHMMPNLIEYSTLDKAEYFSLFEA